MELNHSEKLDEVLKNGYANKIADFLPSLVEDYDMQKSIYGDLYIHYSKMMDAKLVDQFNSSIDFDYKYMVDIIKDYNAIGVRRELLVTNEPNTNNTTLDYKSMLIAVISSGFDGYVSDLIAPKQLCSYDYTKGNVYDEMLTDLMPEVDLEDNYDDGYIARLNEAIEIDYNTGLNRKPVVSVTLPMAGLYGLTTPMETYSYLYRTVKHSLKSGYRLSEDKASRISNILACSSNKNIYNHRDVISDIVVTADISNGIKVLYTLMQGV
jgi:hypothetical protein